jgi:hypothetical protein
VAYGGDAWVSPADFLNLGAVPLNELAVVMDVRPVREEKCAVRWYSTGLRRAVSGGRFVVGRVRIPTCAFPPGSKLLWTAPAVPPYAGDVRQSAILYNGHCCVQ